MTGSEPASSAWKAEVFPASYAASVWATLVLFNRPRMRKRGPSTDVKIARWDGGKRQTAPLCIEKRCKGEPRCLPSAAN